MTVEMQLVAPPPRPRRHDPEILKAALEQVFQHILDESGADEANADAVRREVLAVLEDCYGDYDGYKLARMLEQVYYWEPSEGLVSALGAISGAVFRVHRERVQEWVKANAITPALEVGAIVEYKSGWETKRGIIADVRREIAEYIVQEGRDAVVLTHGFATGHCVPYEDVTAIPASVR